MIGSETKHKCDYDENVSQRFYAHLEDIIFALNSLEGKSKHPRTLAQYVIIPNGHNELIKKLETLKKEKKHLVAQKIELLNLLQEYVSNLDNIRKDKKKEKKYISYLKKFSIIFDLEFDDKVTWINFFHGESRRPPLTYQTRNSNKPSKFAAILPAINIEEKTTTGAAKTMAIPKAVKKSWLTEDSLILHSPLKEGYTLIPAGAKDAGKVIQAYAQGPIAGYDIASVDVIYNPSLNRAFAKQIRLLQNRHGNSDFSPRWSRENNSDWRKKIYHKLENMALSNHDDDFPNVKLLPLWRKTKPAILPSLLKTGFANLADDEYFSKGLYFSYEADHNHWVYSQGTLLVTWVAYHSAYPAIYGDTPKLHMANYQIYDAHFMPMATMAPSTTLSSEYILCKPWQEAIHHRIWVNSVQCLPRYLVKLQPSLPKAPSNNLLSSTNLLTSAPTKRVARTKKVTSKSFVSPSAATNSASSSHSMSDTEKLTKSRGKIKDLWQSNGKYIATHLAFINGKRKKFSEYSVRGDGNCGFTVLGISRRDAVALLMELKENTIKREMIIKELIEAFQLFKNIQGEMDPTRYMDTAIRIKFQKYYDRLIAVNRSESDQADILREMVKDREIFINYVQSYDQEHGRGLWLGVESMRCIAEQKRIGLIILGKRKDNNELHPLSSSVIPLRTGNSCVYVILRGGHYNFLVDESDTYVPQVTSTISANVTPPTDTSTIAIANLDLQQLDKVISEKKKALETLIKDLAELEAQRSKLSQTTTIFSNTPSSSSTNAVITTLRSARSTATSYLATKKSAIPSSSSSSQPSSSLSSQPLTIITSGILKRSAKEESKQPKVDNTGQTKIRTYCNGK